MKRNGNRWRRVPAAFALSLLAAGTALAAESLPGRWLRHNTAETGDGGREYKLYVPKAYRGAALPLIVMLHGCTQDADTFAQSTRMNAVAEKGPFLVLYPEQKRSANPARCWNWFMPANQARDTGEPSEIVAMVADVSRRYSVDRRRVYVAGLSAGGSMSAVLAACYPEVFAAAAVHGGTMYKAASSFAAAQKVMATGGAPDPDALGAEAWACGGRTRFAVPIVVWHGQGDRVVNRRNGDQLVRQFARLNDWADDGRANGSVPREPVRQGARVPDGHPYTVTRYPERGRTLIEYYQVSEMGHAWSGGSAGARFSDPRGPDASALTWAFFQQHAR